MNMNRLFYYMIYHRRNLWSDSLVCGDVRRIIGGDDPGCQINLSFGLQRHTQCFSDDSTQDGWTMLEWLHWMMFLRFSLSPRIKEKSYTIYNRLCQKGRGLLRYIGIGWMTMTLKDSRWIASLPRWPRTHIFALNFHMDTKIRWFEKGNSILH